MVLFDNIIQIFNLTYVDHSGNPSQTHYQLTSHLQSNTLELDDKAQTLISAAKFITKYFPCGVSWASPTQISNALLKIQVLL
jgi:hypothetical protein